jgi:hypothetical protein
MTALTADTASMTAARAASVIRRPAAGAPSTRPTLTHGKRLVRTVDSKIIQNRRIFPLRPACFGRDRGVVLGAGVLARAHA